MNYMTKKEIRKFKSNLKKIYNLPYTAKNGVHFTIDGKLIITQYGTVLGDDNYIGENRYIPMLRHIEKDGDGTIKYDIRTRVSGRNNEDLEILSKAIIRNIKRNREAFLKDIR